MKLLKGKAKKAFKTWYEEDYFNIPTCKLGYKSFIIQDLLMQVEVVAAWAETEGHELAVHIDNKGVIFPADPSAAWIALEGSKTRAEAWTKVIEKTSDLIND